MTIRAIFMVLTIPLFLLMAGVNGAVLYFQEQSELERALSEQTRAAAVVAAEFVAEMDDAKSELKTPNRSRAIDAAFDNTRGLQGLYMVEVDGSVTPLATQSIRWTPPVKWRSTSAQPEAFKSGNGDETFFAAIHPAGEGRAVVARVDAAPLIANRNQILQFVLLIIAGVSVFSAGLSWWVARRIVRELQGSGANLAPAGETPVLAGDPATDRILKIRETRDLSDAVRLMHASRDAADTRHKRTAERQDKQRNLESVSIDLHEGAFPSATFSADGGQMAVRLCGDVPAGAFYAAVETASGIELVIGRCAAFDAQSGLANAIGAKRFIEENWTVVERERALDLLRRSFQIEQIASVSWPPHNDTIGEFGLACITDEETASNVRRIISNSGGLTPNQILNSIVSLLEPAGVIAIAGPHAD